MQIFKALVVLGALAFGLAEIAPANAAECKWKFCRDRVEAPTTRIITNTNRQRIGDLYSPGPGRRLQIRDNDLKILGYIEPSGRITNPHRQKVGSIEELIK